MDVTKDEVLEAAEQIEDSGRGMYDFSLYVLEFDPMKAERIVLYRNYLESRGEILPPEKIAAIDRAIGVDSEEFGRDG